jgi:uncharacterized protein
MQTDKRKGVMILYLIVFLLGIQMILFAGHWFLYSSLTLLLPLSESVSFILRLALAFLSISFLLASIIGARSASIFARAYYKLAAYWIAVLYCIFPATILSVLIHILIIGLNLPISSVITTLLLLGSAFAYAVYKIYISHIPVLTQVKVKLKNLPNYWRGKKVVLITDTHFGHIRHHWFAEQIVSAVAALNPSAVFIGGDFFDGVPADLTNLAQTFKKLKPPHGNFFVTGNHEEFGTNKDEFVGAIKSAGIRVLDNEAVEVEGLQLVGVDYKDTKNPDKLAEILKKIGISDQAPTILLKHVPNNLEVAEAHNIDLHLSGHTHLGQVYPFQHVTQRLFKGYDYGLKQHGSMQVYTSSGAGSWGPPIRVGTHSEIVEITFE